MTHWTTRDHDVYATLRRRGWRIARVRITEIREDTDG